jgi:hypothetical protein
MHNSLPVVFDDVQGNPPDQTELGGFLTNAKGV